MTSRPTANLRGTHDLGEIVGYAWRLYINNFAPLFLVALLAAPPQLLAVIAQRQIADDGVAATVSALMQLLGLVVGVIAGAALIYGVHEATGGTRPDFGRSLDAAFERLGSILTTFGLDFALLFASAFAAPFLAVYWLIRRDATIDGRRDWWLAIVPGLLFAYLAVRWVFSITSVMIDGTRNWLALDASANAVRGMWWRTLGILIVVGLIQVGPILIGSASMLAAPIVEGVVTSGVSAFVLPFGIAAQTLLYYDLKARNAHEFRPAPIDDPQPDVPRQST